MIVVDTSVLIGLVRKTDTPAVRRLKALEQDGVPWFLPLECVQEVLQGARSDQEWKRLHDNLTSQRLLVPADPLACHVEAARIYFECRRKGITLRGAIDALIAAQVLEGDHVLLHDDEDYERMKAVRGLRTLQG
jgi:predicted nucleic acid-binding protein